MLLYKQIKTIKKEEIQNALKSFLIEDKAGKDATTITCVPNELTGVATLRAREKMVFCGEPVINNIFSTSIEVKQKIKDGQTALKGDELAEIFGPMREILNKERVMLNLIQRMSGISTLTHKYKKKLKNKDIHVLDTRKTTPGLRVFEKYAVSTGGGSNHRLDLSSGVLIKDNHMETMSPDFWKNYKKGNKKKPIQIEIDRTDQITATNLQLTDGYLLDNMSPSQIKKCIEKIENLNKENKAIFIEVSGGINLNSIQKYSIEGVNGISVGALTHQATSVDIGLDIK